MKNQAPASARFARYDATTIWLHWTTAALIATLWTLGQTADLLPRGPLRTGAWSLHVLLGFATIAVLLWRIAWRARCGRTLPPADTGILQTLATATHTLLYILIATTVALGLTDALYRGFNIFGVLPLPQIGTNDTETRHTINEWHELSANALLLLALFHALAALVHHYLWRDHLLERMTPERNP